jgi:hypothetical protein
MTNTLAQSTGDHPLVEASTPAITSINPKFTAATPRFYSEELHVHLGELLRRLSDLVDKFARLSRVGDLPFEKPENPNQWNILECVDAIIPVVSAHGGNQFQRPLDDCYPKSSHQAALTGPSATCVNRRPNLFTKSSCSEAGTW